MWRHFFIKAAFVLYVVCGAWQWYAGRPVRAPDGVLAAAEPDQIDLPPGGTLRMGHWTLTPRASYRLTARVLAVEHYRFDALADLVPLDAALGWGPMSDNRVLKGIQITQDHRFYFWHADRMPTGGREAISTHSANTHLIPSDTSVARLLEHLRPGQVVTLRGILVDGQRDDGTRFRTSMSRSDQGPGACEVMLVADVQF